MTVDTPVVLPGDLGDVPGARSIRRFTVAAGRARAGASAGTLLGDVYYAVISLAIGAAVAFGAADQLRVSLPPAPDVAPLAGLSLPTLVAVVLVGGVGALVSLAGRLGPVGAGGAEAAWWLNLPVDRRGLLRPAARRVPVVAALAGATAVALLDGGLLGDAGGRVARAAVAGALAGALVVLGAAVLQSVGAARRRVALVGDLLLAAAALLTVGLAIFGTHLTGLPVPPWPALAGGAAVLAGAAVLVDHRLGRMPARSLRESGSVASHAVGAMVSLDSRELGRALAAGTTAPVRRFVSRLRLVRGPATALVGADVALLRRSPRHLVQLVLAALVPALATAVPQLAGSAGMLLAVLLAGTTAASASAEGARHGEMNPSLDRLLPLPARTARRLRMVVPLVALLAWSLVVGVSLGRWAGSTGDWLALAVAGAPVWAAAAVRGAYRPAPDWGKPLVSTPMGALPTGVASVVARGPDLVVLCLLPTWIAILLGTAGIGLLVVQVVLAVIAVLVGSSTRTKSFMDWLGEQMDEGRKR